MEMREFLLLLLVVSTLTGLCVEAVKALLREYKVKYHANMLAGIVAIVLSVAVGGGYAVYTGVVWDGKMVICMIALVFLSWLCALVGYDKVVQTLAQIRGDRKD